MLSKLFPLVLILLFFRSGYAQIQDTGKYYSFSTVSEFRDQMRDLFNDPNFSNANWGVVIQSLKTGEYFFKKNENKLFVPASNIKLFTSSAGLLLLGSEYRFSTNIYTRGEIEGSILDGDIIIQGRGDPTLSGRFYNGDMLNVFNKWADSIVQLGIDEITGNIIGDDNEFDDQGLGSGWAWDYESNWFSAQSSSISFNDNCIDIMVTWDSDDQIPVVTISPETKYVIVLNNVSAVPIDSVTDIQVYRERGSNVINVYGSLREAPDTVRTFVTVNNPTQYAMLILKDVLEKKGITIKGYPMDVDDISIPIDYRKLKKRFTYYSPALREIIKIINKNSSNFYAEQLLKTIGLEMGDYGSIDNGLRAASDMLEEMGIVPEDMIIVDGSGLSRLNLVTPKQIVDLLTFMYKSNQFITFLNSLSIAGVDGTFGNRLKNTLAEGRIRAKTGFLENVRSLSGYAYTGDNELIAFSIIVNNINVPVKLAENLQDLVCLQIANFKRK